MSGHGIAILNDFLSLPPSLPPSHPLLGTHNYVRGSRDLRALVKTKRIG